MRTRTLLVSVALVAATAACTPVGRAAECVAAEACDQALELPFGDFDANDPVFGDDLNADGTVDGSLGDTGSCWQNANTAATCIEQCNAFLAEQVALAKERGDDAVEIACGGDPGGEGEGEGEGE